LFEDVEFFAGDGIDPAGEFIDLLLYGLADFVGLVPGLVDEVLGEFFALFSGDIAAFFQFGDEIPARCSVKAAKPIPV